MGRENVWGEKTGPMVYSCSSEGDQVLRGDKLLRGVQEVKGDQELKGERELKGDQELKGDRELKGDWKLMGDWELMGDREHIAVVQSFVPLVDGRRSNVNRRRLGPVDTTSTVNVQALP